MYTVGVITASDKGAAGLREDKSGPLIMEILQRNNYSVERYVVIPDDAVSIRSELLNMCDNLSLNLIVTTGGTGFSMRDVTPEATREVIEREAPGIPEAIRQKSLEITPRAMLSRAVCGIRGKSLILNLPGSPKAVEESLIFVLDSISHGLDILLGTDSDCAADG